MDDSPETVADLYRELVTTQTEWRAETRQLVTDYSSAIAKLDSARQTYKTTKWIIGGLIAVLVTVCIFSLIYKGKLKICTVKYQDFVLMTDNCPVPKD